MVVDAINIVFNWEKLNVNANKNTVVFERAQEVVVDFMIPYKVYKERMQCERDQNHVRESGNGRSGSFST